MDYLVVSVITIITIIIVIFIFYKWSFNYWQRRGLPQLKPSFPFGTLENPIDRTMPIALWLRNNYITAKSLGHKHIGIYNFWSPVYMPIHPEYIKNVLQRDFDYFSDRGMYYNEKDDPLSAHLLALGGRKWKILREKMSHTFTSTKIKTMFEIVVECTHAVKKAMDKLAEEGKPIDIKDIVSRFSTDVIGSIAFGLDCNSFERAEAEFEKYGKKVYQKTKIDALKLMILSACPQVGKLLRIRMVPKETSNFFIDVIRQTINYRRDNNIVRNDMLQLLINMMKQEERCLTFEEVAAQAFVFFLGGFDSESNTLQFVLFELSRNQLVQEIARNEIKEVLNKHNHKITYEALADMKYMEQVINESIRLYPITPNLPRMCVKDYAVPDTNIVIEKGTLVFIPALGLHYDPEHYTEPEKFNPDRFSGTIRKHISSFTFFPFGGGPKKCIAISFAIMEMKIILAMLLQNYKFSLNENTEIPLKLSRVAFSLRTTNTIWLNAERIT